MSEEKNKSEVTHNQKSEDIKIDINKLEPLNKTIENDIEKGLDNSNINNLINLAKVELNKPKK